MIPVVIVNFNCCASFNVILPAFEGYIYNRIGQINVFSFFLTGLQALPIKQSFKPLRCRSRIYFLLMILWNYFNGRVAVRFCQAHDCTVYILLFYSSLL